MLGCVARGPSGETIRAPCRRRLVLTRFVTHGWNDRASWISSRSLPCARSRNATCALFAYGSPTCWVR
ncbi:hypothetical protein BBSC_1853 [Bifidobacterium scardovii JCM 12489 = DSM 13734]|nr:hypothetical protein BBSC_1853 [Bifidobacterium scardovii JCM 12489 = DSM 13734]